MATDDGRVLELVVFKLMTGASREDFVGTVHAVSSWIAEQPGFVSRSLVEESTLMVHGERVHAA